MYLFIYLFKC